MGRRERTVKFHNPRWVTHKWEIITITEILPKARGFWLSQGVPQPGVPAPGRSVPRTWPWRPAALTFWSPRRLGEIESILKRAHTKPSLMWDPGQKQSFERRLQIRSVSYLWPQRHSLIPVHSLEAPGLGCRSGIYWVGTPPPINQQVSCLKTPEPVGTPDTSLSIRGPRTPDLISQSAAGTGPRTPRTLQPRGPGPSPCGLQSCHRPAGGERAQGWVILGPLTYTGEWGGRLKRVPGGQSQSQGALSWCWPLGGQSKVPSSPTAVLRVSGIGVVLWTPTGWLLASWV